MNSPSSFSENLEDGLLKGKYKDCKSYLDYMNVEYDLLVFKGVQCNENKVK